MNLEIFDGLQLVRNNKTDSHDEKTFNPFDKLVHSFSNFFDTHNVSINFTEPEDRGRQGSGGGGGFFNFNRQAIRRERRYSKYAFLVLLGIFGLTAPLFMKVLAIVAAQSLMAAKAALIIVGSVALKKLFEKKEEKPVVKVATVPLHDGDDDGHDRLGYDNGHSPYGYYYETKDDNSPYVGYYSENNFNEYKYAPAVFGKRFELNKITKTR